MARTFFLRTFGCQMNEHDSQRIAADFEEQGLVRAERLEDADVVVLNTCCIRENADNKLYGHLGHLKSLREQRPGLQIAVGGCLAQKDREGLAARAPFVDAICGTHNIAHAKALLDRSRREGRQVLEILEAPPEDEDPFPVALPVRPELSYAAWVTIQVGCDNSCAFCIVPSVRGPEQSRPFMDLVAEVRNLARRGTSEITLVGQNVNSFGRDLSLRLRKGEVGVDKEALVGKEHLALRAGRVRPLFPDLLRALGAVEGIRRIRFTSPHPKDLSSETIAAMAETAAVCEQLHLPLQSGSDRILAAMRRGYTAERYLERLARARREIPDLAVTTDIIVGFPGESDKDFENTLEVAAEAGYDSAYTFIFSPRPGTRAAEMTDQFVPDEVIAERFSRLKDVIDRSARRANEARIGRVEEVVVEGCSKREPADLEGRTRQGKLVLFRSGDGALEPGRYATVKVTAAGAHHLRGELEGVEPKGRVRRPISVKLSSS